MSYLQKIPKSAEQVLEVINEANKKYQDYKILQKSLKSQYEKDLHNKNIYIGTLIRILGQFEGRTVEVLNIQGNIVHILDKNGDGKNGK